MKLTSSKAFVRFNDALSNFCDIRNDLRREAEDGVEICNSREERNTKEEIDSFEMEERECEFVKWKRKKNFS